MSDSFINDELFLDAINGNFDDSVLDSLAEFMPQQRLDDPFLMSIDQGKQEVKETSSAVREKLLSFLGDPIALEVFLKKVQTEGLEDVFNVWKSLFDFSKGNCSASELDDLLKSGAVAFLSKKDLRSELLQGGKQDQCKALVQKSLKELEAQLAFCVSEPASRSRQPSILEPVSPVKGVSANTFLDPMLIVVLGKIELLPKTFVCDVGRFELTADRSGDFHGVCVVLSKESDVDSTFLLSCDCPVSVLLVDDEVVPVEYEPYQEHVTFIKDQKKDPLVALCAFAARISKGRDIGPIDVVEGGVDATASTSVDGIDKGQCVPVKQLLPGGAFVSTNGSGEQVVLPLEAFQFSSAEVCKVWTSSKEQVVSRKHLSVSRGDFIHVISKSVDPKNWIGFSGGRVGVFHSRYIEEDEQEEEGYDSSLHAFGKSPPRSSSPNNTMARRRHILPKVPSEAPTPLIHTALGSGSLDSGPSLMSNPPDEQGFNQLVSAMMQDQGIERQVKRKVKGKKTKKPHLNCWEGQEAVTWLVGHRNSRLDSVVESPRSEAIETMQQLLNAHFFYNVLDPSVQRFTDDGDLWRFWMDGDAPPLNVKVILNRFTSSRHPLVIVKALLESVTASVLPCVRMTSTSIELDFYRLREMRKWAEFEVGVCELQQVRFSALLSEDEQVCFWINLYNLLAVHSCVCNKGLVTGGWKGGFFTDSNYMFDGNLISLFQIHNGILRGNYKSNPLGIVPFAATDYWTQHIIQNPDPRVLFALCGCFKDSPPLRYFEPQTLNAALSSAMYDYLDEHLHIDIVNCTVTLPGLMAPFARDFGKDTSSILLFISKYVGEEEKQMLAFLSQSDVTVIKYDEMSFDLYPPGVA